MALNFGPPPSPIAAAYTYLTCAAKGASCMFWQQHINNQSIRERTKEPTESSLLRQRCLRWFGHLLRRPPPPHGFMTLIKPNVHGWNRPRGRPKTRWANSIKHDLHSAGLNTTNAANMVFDRPQWKAFVNGTRAGLLNISVPRFWHACVH